MSQKEWAILRLCRTAEKMDGPDSPMALRGEAARVEFRAIAKCARVVSHPDSYTEADLLAAKAYLATLAEEG